MLSAADWAAMTADLAAVRGDNPVSIVIRRGETSLAAQTVRVARTGSTGRTGGDHSEEFRARVVVMGAPTLDIQVEDRFTVSGVLYRVTMVRPNRKAATMADAELVE